VRRSLLAPVLRRGGRIDPHPPFSFHEGMQTLTDALHAHDRANIRLNSPARSVRRTAGGFEIETGDDRLAVDAVVLTLPADAAARVIQPLAPDAAARLGTLCYNPLAVVHLHAETNLRGLGYQVSLRENTATRGVTWNDSLFGRDGVYTAFLGGARMPDIVRMPDERLGSIAAQEFEHATGHPARPLAVARERMPAWDRSWAALEGLVLPEGVHVCANWWSRPGIPGRLQEAKQLAYRLAAAGSSGTGGPAVR
jgi:oxygen-dependent protoporphyrinogen oxidase